MLPLAQSVQNIVQLFQGVIMKRQTTTMGTETNFDTQPEQVGDIPLKRQGIAVFFGRRSSPLGFT